MSPVPPVEPATVTPPPEAVRSDEGPPSATPKGRHGRRAGVRYSWPLRATLVLATAALSAAALVTANGLEGDRHLDAATARPATTQPGCCQRPALPRPVSASPEHTRTHAAPSSAPRQVKSHPDPSGVPVPAGNLPGWRLTYSQDFGGSTMPTGWGAYTGEPGGDPYGYWDPANVSVSNGELHLRTTANDDPQMANASSTGGVGFYGNPQVYGMYLVRMKGDYEPGLQISNILLLWPTDNNVWPPEIDFYEDEGGSRNGFAAALHPGPDGDDCCVINNSFAVSATQWHTYGIMWTPTSITYTIDGRPAGVVQESQLSPPAQWPNIPMNLDLQSQNLGSAQPNGSVETMTVAWIAEYAPSS